ncbi:hypothetical protein P5G51_004115 [Virgibacillus sp. 179-BFC.A HS]|uniref:Uncharacterized protein n=1 Tax=Tigheibacillus jepli TaxID=3035914 RepID=A0ABU5CGJ6_9BACI|nr:hypothetical protein [Virgibacillus sp. 179-BFC.A HS]MDY0404693.1 hypothetical protein [Virgibacillus sp. 179-BFC.A HS]
MEGIDLSLEGAIRVLHAHEIACDADTAEKWLIKGCLKATKTGDVYVINELDVFDFLIDLSHIVTSQEKLELELQLGISPF